MKAIDRIRSKAFGFVREFTAACTEAAVNPAVETHLVTEKQRKDHVGKLAVVNALLEEKE